MKLPTLTVIGEGRVVWQEQDNSGGQRLTGIEEESA